MWMIGMAVAVASPDVDRQAAADPELVRCAALGAGPVSLAWKVVEGRVEAPVVQGEQSALGGCVVGRLMTWTFPTDGVMQRTFVFVDPATTTAISSTRIDGPPLSAVPALVRGPTLAPNLVRPRVLLQTDDVELELVDAQGVTTALEALMPGNYQLVGSVGGADPVVMGKVDLAFGDVVTIRCSQTAMRCKVKSR